MFLDVSDEKKADLFMFFIFSMLYFFYVIFVLFYVICLCFSMLYVYLSLEADSFVVPPGG